MKRLHLFEFEDQEWLPSIFRNLLTDILQYQIIDSQFYIVTIPKIEYLLEKTGCIQIIDCCAGASGPWPYIIKKLTLAGYSDLEVILTDKYPHFQAWKNISQATAGKIKYYQQPVDATAMPSNLKGIRTFFTSFHHFQPENARKIFLDTVTQKSAIAIFEFTNRNIINVIGMLLGIPNIFAITKYIQPITKTRFFWTYILPIIPIIYWWDGTVSHLRTYSPSELHTLATSTDNHNYYWETGKIPGITVGYDITYLIGHPK